MKEIVYPYSPQCVYPTVEGQHRVRSNGFTLIELSIVLMIIGLLVGGVLVGQDLIKAAEIRSQISQIEKYQTAVNTFKLKYGYLPGDIPDPTASAFGFVARGTDYGQGNGDGILMGWVSAGWNGAAYQGTGEVSVFWRDLSEAGLIGDSFSTATNSTYPLVADKNTPDGIAKYMPKAKIEQGNSVFVLGATLRYGGLGYSAAIAPGYTLNGAANFFILAAVTQIFGYGGCTGCTAAIPALTPQQAYAIDSKMDDGMPNTGRVHARYVGAPPSGIDSDAVGVSGTPNGTFYPHGGWIAAGQPTSCFDLHGLSSTNPNYFLQTYSLTNTDKNCALSFKFQ